MASSYSDGDQTTVAFFLPRNVRVPIDLYEKLVEFAANYRTKQKSIPVTLLLEAGLQNIERRTLTTQLIASVDEIHNVLTAVTEQDISPHPCPNGVDPTYWADREHDRLRQLTEQQTIALRNAHRLAKQAKEALKGL